MVTVEIISILFALIPIAAIIVIIVAFVKAAKKHLYNQEQQIELLKEIREECRSGKDS